MAAQVPGRRHVLLWSATERRRLENDNQELRNKLARMTEEYNGMKKYIDWMQPGIPKLQFQNDNLQRDIDRIDERHAKERNRWIERKPVGSRKLFRNASSQTEGGDRLLAGRETMASNENDESNYSSFSDRNDEVRERSSASGSMRETDRDDSMASDNSDTLQSTIVERGGSFGGDETLTENSIDSAETEARGRQHGCSG